MCIRDRVWTVSLFVVFSSAATTLILTELTQMMQLCYGDTLQDYLKASYAAAAGLLGFLCAPFIGGLSDIYGRRIMLVFCACFMILPYLTATILARNAGYTDREQAHGCHASLNVFVVFSGLAGVGSGSYWGVVNAYVAENTEEPLRDLAFGLVSASPVAGLGFGALLSEFDVVQKNPVHFFGVAACLQALVLPCAFLLKPPPPGKQVPLALSSFHHPINSLHLLRRTKVLEVAAWCMFLSTWAIDGLLDALQLYLVDRGFYPSRFPVPLLLIVGASWLIGAGLLLPIVVKKSSAQEGLALSLAYAGFELVLAFFMLHDMKWLPYVAFGISSPVFMSIPLMFRIVSDASEPESQGETLGALQCVRQLSAILGALFPIFLRGLQDPCDSYYSPPPKSMHFSSQNARDAYQLKDCWAFGLPWLAGAVIIGYAAFLAYSLRPRDMIVHEKWRTFSADNPGALAYLPTEPVLSATGGAVSAHPPMSGSIPREWEEDLMEDFQTPSGFATGSLLSGGSLDEEEGSERSTEEEARRKPTMELI
eukprot:TRINITY_DN8164_c0_g1_i4.p1 TRINITY_DN8164_c0_g1~~TRINITY_DN8164_c0_g1_i4.p1  ORF type:complete len:537 (-),score=103.24 TRINITY_DN8164_c0_g1_i4:212-1822(-)